MRCTPSCSPRRTSCWPTWPTRARTGASALAETLCIDKGSVSRQVQHLVDLGLVDRAPDPADGRATLVSASAEAVRRIDAVTEDRRQWLDERLGSWGDAELASFASELGRYNAALDERA